MIVAILETLSLTSGSWKSWLKQLEKPGFYAEGIPKDQQTDLFVEPLDTPQAGVERVLEKHGSEARIVAIPDRTYWPN